MCGWRLREREVQLTLLRLALALAFKGRRLPMTVHACSDIMFSGLR